MHSMITKIFLSVILALLMLKGGNAQEVTSAYTKINLDECLLLDADDMGASWACPGYKGFPLYVAEGDLRFFVSYGFGAPSEKAARQTLPAFNTINNTIEWRLTQINGNFFPTASILRFFPDISDQQGGEFKEGNILVVTKIEAGNTCHIAYIDAQLVDNANEIARNFADSEAPNFNCETDDIFVIPS